MKCTKRLFAILLSTMIVSTNALAEVPNRVAVIGNKAFDLEYVNDPKNQDEIRSLLSQGKKVMVKTRDQWYDNNGETKAERYAPPKMIYKNIDGVVEEITTEYFEKQVSIVIGIESPNEIKVIFNGEVDKQLLTKENLKINGSVLGDKDEFEFDEENNILRIKVHEEINFDKNIEMSFKVVDEETVEKNVRVVNSQKDIDNILQEEAFCDLVIMGEDINLELEGIYGNVFLNGKNIKISNLETTHLQISENSEKITIKSSAIGNLSTIEGVEVVLEDTEVQKTQTTKSNEKPKNREVEEEIYISPWIKARVESIEALSSDIISVTFKEKFDSSINSNNYDDFKIFQNGKEFYVNFSFNFGEEVYFFIDDDIENIDGKWISQNKIESGKSITLKYTANKENGLEINSKYVKSFEVTSEPVGKFNGVDNVMIEVEDGQTFNGTIDNEKRVISIYEDMTNRQLKDTLCATKNAILRIKEVNDNRVVLLVGQNGDIIEYSLIKESHSGKITIEDIKIQEFDKIQLVVKEKLNAENLIEGKFKVYVNDEQREVKFGRYHDGNIEIYLEYNILPDNDKFTVDNKLEHGDKIKVVYEGNSDKLKIEDVIVKEFVATDEVVETLINVSQTPLIIKDASFPGEIVDDTLVYYVPFIQIIKELNGTEMIPEHTTIANFKVDGDFYHIGQDGSIKVYKTIKKIQNIEFENNDNIQLEYDSEVDILINNQNGMKISLEADNSILESTVIGGKFSIKAIGVGTSEIKVVGEMVRIDGSVVQGRNVVITKVVTVTPIEVERIVIPSEVTIEEGNEIQLKAQIYPANATNRSVEWESSDETVVIVNDNGVITGVKVGSAIITAKTSNGLFSKCEVNVKERKEDLFVTIINGEVQIQLYDVKETEKELIIKITNNRTKNLEVFNKYNLQSGANIIKLKIEPGTYSGNINIIGSRKFEIKTFTVDP